MMYDKEEKINREEINPPNLPPISGSMQLIIESASFIQLFFVLSHIIIISFLQEIINNQTHTLGKFSSGNYVIGYIKAIIFL